MKMCEVLTKKELDKMTDKELVNYLSKIPCNIFPKGNSKFKCNKHNRILPYLDIVAGCYFCIMDEAFQKAP